MLAVIDYGGGNLGSLLSALERRNIDFAVVTTAAELATADAAILPGDGAFGATMDALRSHGLDTMIQEHIALGRPFLGICVGMQILFERSVEHGEHEGLGVFSGTVQRLAPSAPRIPHMGWNQLELVQSHPISAGLHAEEYVYFLHSYCVPVSSVTIAAATHGERFSAIVARDHVVATQFHPEKSQRSGAKVLDNFLAMAERAHPLGTR